MGTISSIATGIMDGYTKGLQLNANLERQKRLNERDDLEIDKMRSEKQDREDMRAAELDLAGSRDRILEQLQKEFAAPQAQPGVATPDAQAPTGPELGALDPNSVTQPVTDPNIVAAPLDAPRPTLGPVGGLARAAAAAQPPAAPAATAAPVAPAQQAPAQPVAQAPAGKPALNPLAPMASIPPENRRAFIDRKYELQTKALEDYYNKTRQPEKALAARATMNKLRDAEIEEKGRGALLALASGDPGGLSMFSKVYQLYDDGKAIDPNSGTFDPKTQSWRGVRILDANTGKEIAVRDFSQQQIYGLAANLNAADIAKQNIEQQLKTQAKREALMAEIYKPYTLRPGEKRQVVNPETGKVITLGEGNIPAGYDVVTDEQGNVVLRKNTSTTTKGKADKLPIDVASELVTDALGKSDGSPEGAQARTTALSYLDNIYQANPDISPRTASRIAVLAVTNPESTTLGLDSAGRINKVFQSPEVDNGTQYSLGRNVATPEQMEKVVGLSGMQKAVADMVGSMSAGVAPDQRAAFAAQLVQVAKSPDARSQYLKAAADAGKDVEAIKRQLDLVAKYGPALPDAPTKQPKKIAEPRGLANVPPEIAARMKSRDESAAARAKAEAEKKAKADSERNAKLDALRKESDWITPQTAAVFTPKEAQDYYRKYNQVLPEETLRAIRRRM